MKFRLLSMLLLMLCSQAVLASGPGGQYWFGRLAVLSANKPDVAPVYAMGVTYGYNVSYSASFELDAYKSLAGGEAEGTNGAISWSALSGGATYRAVLSRVAYLKAKLAAVASDRSYSGAVKDQGNTDFELVPSIGGGIVQHGLIGRRFIFEAEASYINQDNYLGSIGVHMSF